MGSVDHPAARTVRSWPEVISGLNLALEQWRALAAALDEDQSTGLPAVGAMFPDSGLPPVPEELRPALTDLLAKLRDAEEEAGRRLVGIREALMALARQQVTRSSREPALFDQQI